MVAPLPCPCCGEDRPLVLENDRAVGLYVGSLSSDTFGIQCHSCGLRMSRGLPDRFPKGLRGLPIEQALQRLGEHVTQQAIEAWNRRVTAPSHG